MSAFSPDIPALPQSEAADLLAKFVPSALRRVPPVAKPWRLPKLLVYGVLTAGFYPARALHVRLRQTLMMHAQQCELATKWLAARLPADDAEVMKDAAKRVRVGHEFLGASAVLWLVSIGTAGFWLEQHHFTAPAIRQWLFHAPQDGVAATAVGLLSVAYLLTIIQANRQLVAMQQYALAFNAACEGRAQPMDVPPLVWGLRPLHVIAGLALAAIGLVWALPMTLAWAALGEFSRDAARGFRVQLAERMTVMSGVDPVVPTADLCGNPDCRSALPIEAAYCPRCGRGVPTH